MQTYKKRKPIEAKCVDCGEVFTAYAKSALRCEKCRKIKAREQSKSCMAYMRGHRNTSKHNEIKPKMTLREVLRELKIYNEKNRTHLSYGQFVLLLEKGEI